MMKVKALRRSSVATVAGALAVIAACLALMLFASGSGATDAYDAEVLRYDPKAFWTMGNSGSGAEPDIAGNGHPGKYSDPVGTATMPNGAAAARFGGAEQYLEVPDAAAISPATTGVLTIEAWIRPDVLQFNTEEGTGYVHWLGKGGTREVRVCGADVFH